MNTGRVPTNASANNLADYRGYVCDDDPPIARKSPPGSLEGPKGTVKAKIQELE